MNQSKIILRPSKAIFSPDENILIEIQLPVQLDDSYYLEVFHLERKILRTSIDANEFEYLLELTDEERIGGRGFGLFLRNSENAIIASSAFDFLSPHRKTFRYGFVCDFKTIDGEKSSEILDFFKDFHLTHSQFYDWVYRHHDYRAPEAKYLDLMGKEIDSSVIKDLISNFRQAGIHSLGYGAVYAAGEDYWKSHREEGLDDYRGNPHCLINTFYIMDIRKNSPWTKHIRRQFRYAVEEFGFDGLHMDTYGYPKRAWNKGEAVYLEKEFPRFIKEVREDLPGAELLFNNVGNWPVQATAQAPQDGVYIEVWEPHDEYRHIRQILQDSVGFGKPVILAAYLAPFRLEENHGGKKSLMAARLLTAVIVIHGGYHLLLGDRGAAITQGYYNDYSILTSDERTKLKGDYDFMVRYGELFYDFNLVDISETHTAGENKEYLFEGAPTSPDGRAGTVWTVVREDKHRKVLSFINLLDQDDAKWNSGKNTDIKAVEMIVDIPLDGEVSTLYYASPDFNSGEAISLEGKEILGIRGPALQVIIPPLSVWGILVVEFNFPD
ncbi:MAG: glycoside hydrolase family 66 protein [Spirochaetaceae bacterium]|jgi:dextranase|nr:glycoside hydrolase family 66 protein [Spirochaetaceae bacterium]